jgi:hypothetical protein
LASLHPETPTNATKPTIRVAINCRFRRILGSVGSASSCGASR